MKEVYIVSAVRTPIGSFGGALSSVGATKLGATAVKEAVKRAGINPEQVDELFMGCVLQANLGQAPARQTAIFAGLPNTVPCTTVNKVCASGLKATMLAAQSIMLGDNDIVVSGGMENMSQTPYYLDNGRYGYKYGHGQTIDGIVKDGLTDVYHNNLMGNSAELCATKYEISREEQDAHAIDSYKRAAAAWDAGKFDAEIVPVEVVGRKGDVTLVNKDEEYKNVFFEKNTRLAPCFPKRRYCNCC